MARTIAKDHDQKRAHILKTAARIFAHEGFDRASMSTLARECGISKANIYHYYDGKDAILYDVLESYLSALRTRICGIDLSGLEPKDQFRRVVREILLAYQGADDEHRVQLNGVAMLPSDQQTILRGYQRDMVMFLSAVIGATAPDGVGADVDKLRGVTMSVFGMLNWYYMWQSGAGPEAREDYAELVAELTLNGLRAV